MIIMAEVLEMIWKEAIMPYLKHKNFNRGRNVYGRQIVDVFGTEITYTSISTKMQVLH